jgi:selenium-binding protein 1
VCPAVLYIWTGQDVSVSNAADFVAVIDFSENSPTYGQILKTVSLVSDPANGVGQSRNEAHHSGLSSDGKYYVTGGLLSFLSNQKEIFVWSVPQDPRDGPTFLYAVNAPGACTDEFLAIGDGKFIVSMMCNDNAGSPGNMALIDCDDGSATSFLQNASVLVGFNPHGFGRLNDGSIFVGDYILPSSLVGTNPSQIVFRDTARYFLADGSLARTFQFTVPTAPEATAGVGQGLGFMDLKAIPTDPLQRSYTCGTNDNLLYLVGPTMDAPQFVLDLSEVNNYIKHISAGIFSIFPDGTRMIATFQLRYVILFDITQPEFARIIHVFDFCSDPTIYNMPIIDPNTNQITTFPEFCANNNNITGSHVIVHPAGESRFIVINYFLHFGLAQFSGTRTVHAFKLNPEATSFTYDSNFNPNFPSKSYFPQQHPTFYSLNSYPHHAQYLKLKN